VWGCGLDSADSRHGPMARSCEHVVNLRTTRKAGNFLTSWETTSFSRRNLCSMESGLRNIIKGVRFEVFTVVRMMTFWVLAPYRLVGIVSEKHTVSIFRAEVAMPSTSKRCTVGRLCTINWGKCDCSHGDSQALLSCICLAVWLKR
jgi:hypothetical protein